MKDGKHIDSYGDVIWWCEGYIHRDDGPAMELSTGDKRWIVNGKLHRVDGPAVELPNGYKQWALEGKTVYSKLENNLYLYNDLSEEFKMSIIKYELTK
jgi:hypothetical protein